MFYCTLILREERQRDRNKDRGGGGKEQERDRERHDQDRRPRRGGARDTGYETASARSRRTDWEVETPRMEAEDATPNPRLQDARTPSHTSWDPDEGSKRPGSSTWDMPSPSPLRHTRDDVTGMKRSLTDDTPLPTPTYRYNAWASDRKSLGITPRVSGKDNREGGEEGAIAFKTEDDKAEWEEEQKRLDRAWYDYDGGHDDTNNPFANLPEEYTKKKEEQLAKTTVKRMSAHQRQHNKVCGTYMYMYVVGCPEIAREGVHESSFTLMVAPEYLCVCACMCVCVRACVHVCVRACVFVYVCVFSSLVVFLFNLHLSSLVS